MQKSFTALTRRGLLLSLVVLGLVAALILLPSQFRSAAGSQDDSKKGLYTRTVSHEEGIENYDIRDDAQNKGEEAANFLAGFRQTAGKNAVAIADVREDFVKGENTLKQKLPTLRIEYNNDIRIPEVIALDVNKGGGNLTGASSQKRSEILRNFISQNNDLVGVSNEQINALKVTADYTNPDGNLSYAHLEQSINDIPVFRGEIKAGFTKNGEMFRVINNLAPGLDYNSLSTNFGDPLNAVKKAAGYINHELTTGDVTRSDSVSNDLKATFGTGDWATTAEKMYFPTEPGVARAAWRVLIWQPVNAYYVIVDAETGAMLWRKNLADDQTQSATYNVYTGDSPSPLSPTTALPGSNTQGTGVARTNVTVIGNEAPNPGQNNLGWITDGANITDGNNVEAGLDIVAPNGVDAPVTGTSRTFSFSYNPPPLGTDAPTDANYRNGSVTNLFYWTNRYHDFVYNAGFTEAARNFQNDNFGRGGVAADRISGEAQDSSGTNNANFAAGADGTRGRMQMYIFTGPTPDRDGSLDADVFVHEMTHGTSNRLVGNNSGLSNTRGGGMGEGWSDFYARMLLATADEDVNGIYASGGYATLNLSAIGTDNYYYGIRRFPYAVKTNVGANSKPHNPLTLADIDPAQISTTDGAFPESPINFSGNGATEVHNEGEIWCMMLLEVRARVIARLGFAAGNQRMLQITTDGLKGTPLSPNFIQARDAIITADNAGFGGADTGDIWAGFATRGAGFGAVDGGSAVTQSFALPSALQVNPFSVSDSTGDGDGFPEPGEPLLLSVAVNNPSGATINNVSVNVTGGGSVNYGNINNGQTVTMNIPYTVPAGAVCGSLHTVTINVVSPGIGTNSSTQTFRLGAPVGGAPVTFSNNTAITINDNAPATPYPSNITVSGLTGNKNIKLNLTGLNHTFPDDIDMLLVGPGGQKYVVMSDAGGTNDFVNTNITIDDNAAAVMSDSGVIAAGSWKPTNYDTTTDVFAAPAPASPYTNASPAGSDTLTSVFGSNGTAMNGTWSLYIRDDLGTDVGTVTGGWSLTFEANDFNCSLAPTAVKSRADFDGDGKTDLSVFRPSEGNWYLNRSTAGLAVYNWGTSTDTLVPGDFDGDGKADTAVFRPSNTAGVSDFFILNSSGFTVTGAEWGSVGDVPVGGDFDGDGKNDVAVFRPSNGTWYILNSSNGSNTIAPFGLSGDVPVSMDTENDGKTNLAVYRPSNQTWYVAKATGNPATNFDAYPFGLAGDLLVPGDYDNDNKTDVAVFRPSNGTWYIRRSTNGGTTIIPFGLSTDVPVPGDYDGDGQDDVAVYRNGTWYINRSTSGMLIQPFGLSTDKAVPKQYIP
jgi:subtilisin-like proprotein convertase family protein